ncbi:PEP-CTERM sorting domain-containing protein [Candidatus Desantisbacteria bacterium]|nr:PEP-CTERM sorting domain-containing protein [Candidatus Desantisbacteria bacterium]
MMNKMKLMGIFVIIAVFGIFSKTAIARPSTNDYGDLPDSYKTLMSSDGARHSNGTYEWFGEMSPDYDFDGQPNFDATGDNINGVNDEDGVKFYNSYVDILVSVSDWRSGRYSSQGLLYVDGWFDWNNDGDFSEVDEHQISFTANPTAWGQNSAVYREYVHYDEDYSSRFRVSYNEGANNYFGAKSWGEVEDYKTEVPPVPEPSTLLLLGCGVLGLFGAHKRK